MSQSPKRHCSPFVKQGKVPLFTKTNICTSVPCVLDMAKSFIVYDHILHLNVGKFPCSDNVK